LYIIQTIKPGPWVIKPTGREVERKEERYIEERYKVLKYNRKR
jgi:hypothetical protein